MGKVYFTILASENLVMGKTRFKLLYNEN